MATFLTERSLANKLAPYAHRKGNQTVLPSSSATANWTVCGWRYFEEHSKEVCGAVINIHTKGDEIDVWTREAEDQASVLHIGHVDKECLGLSVKTITGYQAHTDMGTKSNSLAKNKFVV
ncbi:Eukaryotic translation initiation factor 4E type 1B [Heterocephalus glaber]|uniref:Eukaryotic translation initiation factor 4E type 1B n=1 Tax=Heterocephalus glaber TaxID=10181 RepID=G5BP51_HETGA|nr:Eukaryotic translation initiation factor 4E type 1B [Heterocephalus glaber]